MLRTIILSLLLFVVISTISCDNSSDTNSEEALTSAIEEARTAIRFIRSAIRNYEQDCGETPESFKQLQNLQYLNENDSVRTDSSVYTQWDFAIEVENREVLTVTAMSTNRMIGGLGHEILYDMLNGQWTTYHYDTQINLIDNDVLINESIEDIRAIMRSTRMGILMYHQDVGELPRSFEELDELQYIEFYSADQAQWEVMLEFYDTDIIAIVAESKEDMMGGYGYTVSYDLQDGYWTILYDNREIDKLDIETLINESIEDAIAAIGDVVSVIQWYERDQMRQPESLDELEAKDYSAYRFDTIVRSQWDLSLESNGDRIEFIVANSTELMPGGVGYKVRYSISERSMTTEKNGREISIPPTRLNTIKYVRAARASDGNVVRIY